MTDQLTPQDMILVLDFGSPYSQILTRKIRELGVYSELWPNTTPIDDLQKSHIKGIILSGGLERSPYLDEQIFQLGKPVLGIASAMSSIAKEFGGKLEQIPGRGYEEEKIRAVPEKRLFKNLPDEQTVWLGYEEVVVEAPEGFTIDAVSDHCPVVAFSNEEKNIYAVQFHPEIDASEYGREILRNFVFDVCQIEGTWSVDTFIEKQVESIRKRVGKEKVLCALSGGVDSSVAATLIHKAIGDQLICIFVDHGLLRKGEVESVMATFKDKFRMNVIKVDAKKRFLNQLKGVTNPEKKRKIIGNEFIRVFDEEAVKLSDIRYLAQGTVYSDVIESGVGTKQTVKSHHNVGGLPEDLEFELIEPLKTLFKDEVRKVGTALGIPDEIVWRQPFPGPGLAVRVLGEVTEEKLAIVRESDWILRDEIKKAGLEREIWQYFTVLPNIRSVGVKDEKRTYDYTVAIRAVNSIDGMTAEWAKIPLHVLDKISRRIVSEVPHVNRVVYDITSKPPATIEWE
mgnify:CR=1 FL=1